MAIKASSVHIIIWSREYIDRSIYITNIVRRSHQHMDGCWTKWSVTVNRLLLTAFFKFLYLCVALIGGARYPFTYLIYVYIASNGHIHGFYICETMNLANIEKLKLSRRKDGLQPVTTGMQHNSKDTETNEVGDEIWKSVRGQSILPRRGIF